MGRQVRFEKVREEHFKLAALRFFQYVARA
jgi:hypothetical protein